MKLYEKIINELEFKTKKNSYLVSSIEKLKYHDLLNLSNIIDDPKFLNEYSSGWNASHYSVLNSNIEVLFVISNFYIKNNCNLNQNILRAKNSSPIGSNTLEIAIHNQKLEHYILLKSFNIKEHKNCSYFLDLQKNKNSFQEKQEFNSELNLPYELSLANLFLLNYQSVGIKLLTKEFHYDEKPQTIKEFLENHQYMSENYIDKPVFQTYSYFFDKVIESKDNIEFNCFDFFSIPFIEIFKIQKEKMSFSYFNNFNKLYDNNPSEFFEQLKTSKYKEAMINTFISMQELLKSHELKNNYKNILNFFETYQIDKFIFSIELSDKLVSKNISGKINKI